MSWKPTYTVTDKLLRTIRATGEALGELRALHPAGKTLAELAVDARELSAYASTSIEGNPLGLTDVKRILKTRTQTAGDTEREVLNYNTALRELYGAVRAKTFTLDTDTIEAVQGQVVDGLMDNPFHHGRIRREPVVIRNPRQPDEIVFMPPDAADVPGLLSGLTDWVNGNTGTTDSVILAGVFHRQFVVIHPFMDGNGRTARLLTTAILGMTGLDLFEIFSFEHYYNQRVSRYFTAVGLTGDYYDCDDRADCTAWLEYFADGILDELRRVRTLLPRYREPSPRLEPHHRQILDYIGEQGSITQREYGAISTRSRAARKLDFEKLMNLGLIERRGVGRGTHYVLAVE